LKQTGDKEKLGSRRKPSEIVYYFPVHEKKLLNLLFFQRGIRQHCLYSSPSYANCGSEPNILDAWSWSPSQKFVFRLQSPPPPTSLQIG